MSRKPFAIATQDGKLHALEVLERYALKGEDDKSRALTQDPFIGSYKEQSLKEPIYDPGVLAEMLEINTWHARCCQTKANDTAGLGWGLKAKGDKENPSEQEHEALMKFFSKGLVNALTIDDLLVAAMLDLEAIGTMYIEIVRDGYKHDGEPALIRQIPAQTMRVHTERNKYCQRRGQRKVWFKRFGYEMDVNYETGDEVPLGSLKDKLKASEILELKHHYPRSDYYGISNIISALGAVEGLRALRDYHISFFDSYGIPSYAVYITGDYDLGDADENGDYQITKDIEEKLQAVKENPHSVLVFGLPKRINSDGSTTPGNIEVEFVPLSAGTKEASFRLYHRDQRDEVLSAHGVPGYRAAIIEVGALGGSSAAESTEIYKTSVVAPRKNKLEAIINKRIIEDGFQFEDWEFWLEDLDTSDEAHDTVVADFYLLEVA